MAWRKTRSDGMAEHRDFIRENRKLASASSVDALLARRSEAHRAAHAPRPRTLARSPRDLALVSSPRARPHARNLGPISPQGFALEREKSERVLERYKLALEERQRFLEERFLGCESG